MHTKVLIAIIAIYLAPKLASATCIHGTSLFPRSEPNVKISSFGYTGLKGPLNWAGLSPENTACATSSVQSPINIDETVQLAESAPKVDIPNVDAAEFVNLGTTIEVEVEGKTEFAGARFALKQFHFHTPSEHRVAEEYFPLEVHMVHEAADGSGEIIVIALTFQLSENSSTTPLLTSVIENLSEIATPGTSTKTGPLDFCQVVRHIQTTPLFQYVGSLTTPPCAEGLTFLVTKDPLPLDVKTFNAIKAVVKFNSRYTQNTLEQQNLVIVGAAALAGSGATNGTEAGVGNWTAICNPVISTFVPTPTPTPTPPAPQASSTTVDGDQDCVLEARHEVPRRFRRRMR